MSTPRSAEGIPQKGQTVYRLLILETRDLAGRFRTRLESLAARYPSPELRQAVDDVRRWEAGLDGAVRQHVIG